LKDTPSVAFRYDLEVIMSINKRVLSALGLGVAGLAVVLSMHSAGAADRAGAQKGDQAATSGESASPVQSFKEAEELKFSWGWIRWLMSAKIDPEAEMTFGIVYVKPNQRNPMHIHPNCEEILHVLSGSCEHLIGDEWLTLKAGDTVRIPRGVRHVARTRDEPMRAVITYSTGNRQMVTLKEAQE
jgi:quercetin dioxygenase-like cupin family protein